MLCSLSDDAVELDPPVDEDVGVPVPDRDSGEVFAVEAEVVEVEDDPKNGDEDGEEDEIEDVVLEGDNESMPELALTVVEEQRVKVLLLEARLSF